MMRGMYAAISGLDSHQTMLDVTANNLANVDTIGYKAQRTTFVDQLSELLRGAAGSNNLNGGSNPVQVGLGVLLGSIDNLMGTGSMQSTGNVLDVAVQGDGFFRVGNGAPDATHLTSGLPTTLQYTTGTPARAAATAWFAPLPPTSALLQCARSVSPGCGKRSTSKDRSYVQFPTTRIAIRLWR